MHTWPDGTTQRHGSGKLLSANSLRCNAGCELKQLSVWNREYCHAATETDLKLRKHPDGRLVETLSAGKVEVYFRTELCSGFRSTIAAS